MFVDYNNVYLFNHTYYILSPLRLSEPSGWIEIGQFTFLKSESNDKILYSKNNSHPNLMMIEYLK